MFGHTHFQPIAKTFERQLSTDTRSKLGRCSAGFTLTAYTRATTRMQEEAASRMGSYMAQNL